MLELRSCLDQTTYSYPFALSLRVTVTMNSHNESPTIPIMDKPASTMQVGPNGHHLSAASRHPVDELQQATPAGRFHDLGFVRHVYGSGLAMRLATEQKLAQQEQMSTMRRGRQHQAGLYGEIVTGQDGKMDFADLLSRPAYRPEFPQQNMHLAMERQLNM